MTCGWCGGSIASANKPHTKGECEMTKVELEWMHAHKKHQEELKALQAKYDALEQAARGLVEYRDHNVLNWQLEKADDFINAMRRVLDGVK